MNWLVPLAVGYALGVKSQPKDVERVAESVGVKAEADDLASAVNSARNTVARTLLSIATVIAGQNPDEETADIVSRVRKFAGVDEAAS
ncbi:MAG TPA: hypothetical protein VGS21_00095 [Acidimicrobiales bacterium]|nr:hypothetical protein [Acidimicrobiales bacterium]